MLHHIKLRDVWTARTKEQAKRIAPIISLFYAWSEFFAEAVVRKSFHLCLFMITLHIGRLVVVSVKVKALWRKTGWSQRAVMKKAAPQTGGGLHLDFETPVKHSLQRNVSHTTFIMKVQSFSFMLPPGCYFIITIWAKLKYLSYWMDWNFSINPLAPPWPWPDCEPQQPQFARDLCCMSFAISLCLLYLSFLFFKINVLGILCH